MRAFTLLFLSCVALGCNSGSGHYIPESALEGGDSLVVEAQEDTVIMEAAISEPRGPFEGEIINTGTTRASELVNFAETLQGIPYLYGSVDPSKGFDCSGFITHVFNHFNITVPRSSVDFTNVEKEIPLRDAKRGDIILFTGTDSTKRVVGHMGIITSLPGEEHKFIHSTSGKAYGVTITPLNSYYQGRFEKAIRIFRDND